MTITIRLDNKHTLAVPIGSVKRTIHEGTCKYCCQPTHSYFGEHFPFSQQQLPLSPITIFFVRATAASKVKTLLHTVFRQLCGV